MSARRVLRNIVEFLSGVVERDRYLTEAFAALVTFGVGIIGSVSQDSLSQRQSLSGFRDMPCPELWLVGFCLPGIWSACKLWKEGEVREGRVSLNVMLSFVALSAFSYLLDLDNWAFWTLLALQLGILKGYALILEWSYLRWSVACIGCFFWISLTVSIASNTIGAQPLALSPYIGWAAINVLSVWRARGKRDG